MLEKIFKSHISAEKLDEMYDIELEEAENSLIFKLIKDENSKKIPFMKKFIVLKHRASKKEISKEIKKSAIFSGEDVKKLENGVIDPFLKFKLSGKTVQIRPKFLKQHEDKSLLDDENKAIMETYPTVNKKVSLTKRDGVFKTYLESVEESEDYLKLDGKFKVLGDSEFDEIEIFAESNKGGELIVPCKYSENGEYYDFTFKFDANELTDKLKGQEINSAWDLSLILKNNGEEIDKDNLRTNKIGEFEKEADYNLQSLKINEFLGEGRDIRILLYSTKGRNLKFQVLTEENYNNKIKKAENLDKYQHYKENLKIDDNLVFFESFHGKYNNNPKYIYEKMLEMGYDSKFKFVWSFKDDELNGEDIIPGNPIIVSDEEEDYYKYLATAKYKINNATFLNIIDKRKKVIHLQTWHGTPLKRLGSDINVENPGVSWNHFNNEVKTWNYLISANRFSSETFKRAFNYKNKVLEMGYPANDIFYQDNENKINELKERFGIGTNKKIILYAPTFRDNKFDEEGNRIFDLELDLNKLYNQLNDEYFLIIKTHYVVSRQLKIDDEMKDFVIDLSSHDDIHELFILSDILITDYSSVFFDYAHSKRPMVFFMPDLEEYVASRGVYEDILENLPGPKVIDNDELIDCLNKIEDVEEEYSKAYEEFYNSYCDVGHGDASERIIEEVFGKL